MNHRRPTLVLAALGASVAAAALALRASGTLVVDGRSTPAEVRTLNGVAYVRLDDVARAMDRTLVARGNGRYEMLKAGGANAVAPGAVPLGETVFEGKWRFTVLDVSTPSTYEMTTDADLYGTEDKARMPRGSHTVTPARNHGLVVVRVRVANGMRTKRRLWTALSDERVHTAIADAEGGSHRPVAFDFEGGPSQTEFLLPGASQTFNVVFALPSGARPKDLVFTLVANDGEDPGHDVRVSLAKP